MPSLRNGRASKACDLCRRHKTRCYASDAKNGVCLRCQTLSKQCSLQPAIKTPLSGTPGRSSMRINSLTTMNSELSLSDRLAQLEKTVYCVVQRLDANPNNLPSPIEESNIALRAASQASSDLDPAPMLLIRDATADAGVATMPSLDAVSDIISNGIMDLETANMLLELFHLHYGRWVRFADDILPSILLSRTRKSPLLFCSACLIAVRHTTQKLADELAPKLFQEVKTLMQQSMLVVPQSMAFFQSVILLSLWSTTIGQSPLGIDSWLLTSHAIVQATSTPVLSKVLRRDQELPAGESDIDAWCIWNHLCVAHLQYCVGTRRQAFLNQSHIDRCLHIVQHDNVTNYEARMAAEVQLYWIIYQRCSGDEIALDETKRALQGWKLAWAALFDQQRSQFLQMGFYFAHLLARSRSRSVAILADTIHLSRTIINLAIETSDDRTRHLTDHIFHILIFAALTLLRLVYMYERKLLASGHDIAALDQLVANLIGWMSSIGLQCHVAHMLSQMLLTQFRKFRPEFVLTGCNDHADIGISEGVSDWDQDVAFTIPEFIESELFNFDGNTAWPQWTIG